jgi:predicted SAM-dependent methyltransferase
MYIIDKARYFASLISRPFYLNRILKQKNLCIYYGCGNIRQNNYINIDLRWTPAIDLVADLTWCARKFKGRCQKVYVSHVLEHYKNPGKAMRDGSNSVLGALKNINKMLVPDGLVRIAVPDFKSIAQIYLSGEQPLYPRLLGRICGEQDYPQNRHLCAFDKQFLEMCLIKCGFNDFENWDPEVCGFVRDASFDEINGVSTSLNILARKVEEI